VGKKFIRDEMRARYINAIYNRIRIGKSVLLTGRYGSGKSFLLDKIRPKTRRVIRLESLNPLTDMLASILQQLEYDVKKSNHYKMDHLRMICAASNGAVIVMDEVNEMDSRLWPWIKRVMDAEFPMVLAGLPKVRRELRTSSER